MQHPLPLHLSPLPPELMIGQSNSLAVQTVLGEWHAPVMILSGEAGSGKSLLAKTWAHQVRAQMLPIPLEEHALRAFAAGNYVIDPLSLSDETVLFHLLNMVRETASHLLICTQPSAHQMQIRLPDLASRLRGARMAFISAPDDGMLHALFIQQLASKQLRVEAGVIAYALTRLPRAFAAVIALVEGLDVASLEKQRPITLPLAREVLRKMQTEA
jgi:chromosomal replication initiation ATPase DnaA